MKEMQEQMGVTSLTLAQLGSRASQLKIESSQYDSR